MPSVPVTEAEPLAPPRSTRRTCRPTGDWSNTTAARFEPSLRHARREQRWLFLERADLVVEHPLRARAFAAGVVDRGDAGLVAQGRRDQRVVRDRRADDGDGTVVDELAERANDVVLGARRETARLLVDQLDLAVEPTGRGDVVEAEPERIGEQAVALREVVQQTDADRNRQWPWSGRYRDTVRPCSATT
jgi:hypothetical protein